MGGTVLGDKPTADQNYGLLNPGRDYYEVGTTSMRSGPKTSVVTGFEQVHDVKNVFIVDAGPFVSQADKTQPGLF